MIPLLDIVRNPDPERDAFSFPSEEKKRVWDIDEDSIGSVREVAEKASLEHALLLWILIALLALAIVIFLALRWRKRKRLKG
ncbi:MAG: hypothetical protein J5548_02680 [Prevotella sp.]|nr:hypothetical protein [Prevotella sp.]